MYVHEWKRSLEKKTDCVTDVQPNLIGVTEILLDSSQDWAVYSFDLS